MHLTSKIPIFITVRANTKALFKQNKEALKYSYVYIKNQNLFDQTYVISDNKKMLEFAINLGFNEGNMIHYECKTDLDIMYLEYLATYKFAIDNSYYPDWIIILNVSQLFKSKRLISDCINMIDDKYDVVASYTEITDKSKFFIHNIDKSNHLLSSEVDRVKMIDAAIYAVRTSFAFECMKHEDPSNHFWSGKMKFFPNTSLFTNIYTIDDINIYQYIGDIISQVNEINIDK